MNHKYSINDLSQGLVRSFLQEIKSKLFDEFDKLTFEDVCRQMNLVESPPEYIKPKKFALMFFNPNPEKIFPKSQIEIVSFQTNIADKNFTVKQNQQNSGFLVNIFDVSKLFKLVV